MKIEAESRLKAHKVVGGSDPDASTAAQGKAQAKDDVKNGWVDASQLTDRASLVKHLEVAIGASSKYANAYFDEARRLLKLPAIE